MKIIIAILIFSAVILFHELGHFLLAKKNGIVVTEFSLGMGPRLVSTEKNGTRYSIKVFPIGGSCAMLGEDTGEDEKPGTFNSAPVWGRISVVAAGPIFNFILAFVIAVIIVAFVGYEPPEIMEVQKGSQAEAAGLKAGDMITEYQGYHIDLGKDLYVYTFLNELTEEPVHLTIERDGKKQEISYTPDINVRYLLGFNRKDAQSMEVESLIEGMPLADAGVKAGDVITSINGVQIKDGDAYEKYISANPLSDVPVKITYMRDGLEYETEITPREYRTPQLGFAYNVGCVKAEGLDILKYGAVEVKYMIRTTVLSLKELITGGLGVKDLSGPVGVVDAIGQTYEQSKSEGTMMVWMNMLNMVVLLSANLGVMNLLPFPALDGGRLVFLIVEAVRRKPVNRELEGMIHFAGLMLLMVLMVVVMYNDILKIF
ncbi:MAG: RIP metalloprotease RseP [Eubacteriales bacterium]|nr:RIP metalloprotease RseP [Eubacteriales bacterium]